jgi:hypothetical protein
VTFVSLTPYSFYPSLRTTPAASPTCIPPAMGPSNSKASHGYSSVIVFFSANNAIFLTAFRLLSLK